MQNQASYDTDIFREYDIRGVYNTQFDVHFAKLLGRAYLEYFRKVFPNERPVLTIGYDARISSPEIATALTESLVAHGAKVYQLGLVTTPISYFSTFNMADVKGAIMVTGSHNPPEYNGFKISVGKATIYGEQIQQLAKFMQDPSYSEYLETGESGFSSGESLSYDIFPQYVQRYAEEFADLKEIPVVIDCGNGASGAIVRKMYEACGLKPHVLYEDPDGRFPNHHPDPTVAENLQDLIHEVRSKEAAIGIGFDGDADRIGVVNEKGDIVPCDELIALISQEIMASQGPQKIIGDVKCSDRMFDEIKRLGGEPIMWKTGHSLIKQKVKEEKAPFGGELSGHLFYADRNYGYDDAPYAGLRVIEILSKTGKSLSELLAHLPPAYNTPEIRIDTTEEKKHTIVRKIKEAFEARPEGYAVNLIDGIRVSYPDGWALARASNTQPVLVLRFESTTEEGLTKIRKDFEDIVQPLL